MLNFEEDIKADEIIERVREGKWNAFDLWKEENIYNLYEDFAKENLDDFEEFCRKDYENWEVD